MSLDSTQNETNNPNQIEIEARMGLARDGAGYFNNFFLLFPATEGIISEYGDYRRLTKMLDKEDKKIEEDYSNNKGKAQHSEDWLGQTWKEFFTTVDQAVKDSGLELEDIQEMRDKIEQTRGLVEQEKLKFDLAEKLIPVYVNLRELGYKHYDLSI